MVHPLVITAAATAGIGAAVAFEVAIFRPWRDENWPNGFGQGVRDEFLKLRREVEQAVNEIQDDLRTLRDGRRRGNGHRRLSDDELDDFRRGVGEEASSESAQHEFEMHERQASAYRNRLQASMSQSLANGMDAQDVQLRRRHVKEQNHREGEGTGTRIMQVGVIDMRTAASPEVPHHSLGDASPSVADEASLASDSRFNSVRSVGAQSSERSQNQTREGGSEDDYTRNGLLGLDFGERQASASAAGCPDEHGSTADAKDPFGSIVDGTASSWHAVFSDRVAEQASSVAEEAAADVSPRPHEALTDQVHMELDTNGLSQTLSEQQHSFDDVYADAYNSTASNRADSPYRSNRALQPRDEAARSAGSRCGATDSEPDFEVLSDTADSEGRWSHLHTPPSPTISSGSEGVDAGVVRESEVISVDSDGEESWAELSEPGSVGENAAR